jgi:hypothetical protein
MLDAIRRLHARGLFDGFDHFRDPLAFDRLMARLANKRWVVYAKRPFGQPVHVLAYLGRYTHRVGISNRRLLHRDGDLITFATKNGQTATVTGVEFLRRFVRHVLPKRFVKIRHYGLYASSHVDTSLARARALIESTLPSPDEREPSARVEPLVTIANDTRCPRCLLGSLVSSPLPAGLDSS